MALMGASGSGKSTLLYLLGALDRPTEGEIRLDGVEISNLDDDDRAAFRNERLGFVFQFHFLPEFTVLENVFLPMVRRGRVDEAKPGPTTLKAPRSRRSLEAETGSSQGPAAARPSCGPWRTIRSIILADEPTGNLDSKSGALVFDIFGSLARDQGRTIVMVTHDGAFAERTDRQIKLRDGRVLEDVRQR
ncbi:MAG: ABC transporter ATP-binding protein [Polyangiaceae bacterium]